MPIDPKIRILLVEDASVMRKMERKTLAQLGLENIIEAENGDDAIAILQRDKDVSLIISDWNMPVKDGYELLLWVRGNDKFKKLPFLMATGRGEKKEVTKAQEAGVSAFISKPFNAEELREKIEESFGQKKKAAVSKEKREAERITSSGKVKLKVSHIQITDHLVLGVLKHLIQAGELKPKHFELETVCLPSWNSVAKALEESTVDASFILAPLAMDLFHYGVPIKMLMYAHKNGSICVRNKTDEEFKEPYQDFFKGKSFFIPHTMSIHNMLAHMFFTGIGLKPGTSEQKNVDVNFEVVAPIKMPESLKGNRDICGYMVAEPLGTKAIAGGIAELQFLSSELWENHPCCVLAIQDDLISKHKDAVQEFVELLVQAGEYIEAKPGLSAEIAVSFLDPDKSLGLKVPILKNVLTEPKGIKTNALYPLKGDLNNIQKYMHDKMGIGNVIDLDKFVDLQFIKKSTKESVQSLKTVSVEDIDKKALEILKQRSMKDKEQSTKALLHTEGKYLTFFIDEQQFGIDILKIIEIIKPPHITIVPNTPASVKGVINLRGKVVPVVDLRLKLDMSEIDFQKSTRIIVMEIKRNESVDQIGIIVDAVSEVTDVKAQEIEEPPKFGTSIDTTYILGMVKQGARITILLNIEHVLYNIKS